MVQLCIIVDYVFMLAIFSFNSNLPNTQFTLCKTLMINFFNYKAWFPLWVSMVYFYKLNHAKP